MSCATECQPARTSSTLATRSVGGCSRSESGQLTSSRAWWLFTGTTKELDGRNSRLCHVLRCSPFLPHSQVMSNVTSVLKEEISRISRKEIRREASSLKKSSTTHRSEIAALKRRVLELERQHRRVGRGGESSQPAAANEDSESPGTRVSAPPAHAPASTCFTPEPHRAPLCSCLGGRSNGIP